LQQQEKGRFNITTTKESGGLHQWWWLHAMLTVFGVFLQAHAPYTG
jgi:hypothetical protein